MKRRRQRIVNSRPPAMTAREFRQCRETLEYSATELAAMLGISSQAVMSWERGDFGVSPPAAVLMRLLRNHPDTLPLVLEATQAGEQARRLKSRRARPRA